jgi:hypothetical protein
MIFRQTLFLIILGLCIALNVASAQTASVFGDPSQPGSRLHNQIVVLNESGVSMGDAINQSIETSLADDNTLLGGESKQTVAFDVPHANVFYDNMAQYNSLIEVTKRVIEAKPEMAVHTVTLALTLYPAHAQEIYDGAALTGVLNDDDLLVALLQAGADPTTFVDATAAGAGPNTGAIPPIGAGIGAGGTGGGDTTASTN